MSLYCNLFSIPHCSPSAGKYPHLRVEVCGGEKKVNNSSNPCELFVKFGRTAIGTTSTRRIRLFNTTPVSSAIHGLNTSMDTSLLSIYSGPC